MVELVDGLDLATNVELLNGVVQVHDSRVLWVTAEDKLSLSSPKLGENHVSEPHYSTNHIDSLGKDSRFVTSNAHNKGKTRHPRTR